MKPLLTAIALILVGVGCSSNPKARVIDTRKGDSGFLFVDIRFPDGHREGYNITLANDLVDKLKQENDSLNQLVEMYRPKKGDIGVVYGSFRITDSLADEKEMFRYRDSAFKYIGIKAYREQNGLDSKEAYDVSNYYLELFDRLYRKYPEPEFKFPKPKDETIYPPQP